MSRSNAKEATLNNVRFKFVTLAIASALVLVVASGCGKPQYCEDRSALQASVKDLPSKATSGGVSGLEAQLTTVENDAEALVSSAGSDFPSETRAIESSITQLRESINDLPEDPSTMQMAAVALNATAVVNSVSTFSSVTSEECN